MYLTNHAKTIACRFLAAARADMLFRHINRSKLLVVMYHGITHNTYEPPLWTQLRDCDFRQQILYLKKHYHIISLPELDRILASGSDFPANAAMVTFDDGLRNNYCVAYPILKANAIPATIFLTTNLLNTDEFLWFDRLYLVIRQLADRGVDFSHLLPVNGLAHSGASLAQLYDHSVNVLKHATETSRRKTLTELEGLTDSDVSIYSEDFGMLSSEQVLEMDSSGLVSFGVHTANHRIVTQLARNEWESEIRLPRTVLSDLLSQDITSFCYPNGRPDVDFAEEHIAYIADCGYTTAFTTEGVLNPRHLNPYRIGRLQVGNDFSSQFDYFRLNTSGCVGSIRGSFRR